MNRSRLMKFVILSILCAVLGPKVWAQAPPTQITPTNDTGIKPFQSYSGIRENINLANGNLNLNIPLVTLPGRNGMNYTLSVQYDSKIWVPHSFFNDPQDITFHWQHERRYAGLGDLGWRLGMPALNQGDWITDSNGNLLRLSDYVATFADGGKHNFGSISTSIDAEDGSFASFDRSAPSDVLIKLKDGTTIHFPSDDGTATTIVDSNGNSVALSPSLITDTLGRQITITDNSSTQSTISYLNSNGATENITLNYTNLTLFQTTQGQYYTGSTPFSKPANSQCHLTNCYNIYVNQPPLNTAYRMLTSIGMPDGTSYTFTYDGYGELTKITYPTGGYTSYDYAAYQHRELFWVDASLDITSDFREVTSRRVCSSGSGSCGSEDVTSYTPTISGTDSNNTLMDVTDAAGFKTRSQFTSTTFDEWDNKYFSPRETLRTIYKADGINPLKTIQTDYNALDGSYISWDNLPIRITTSLYDVSPPLVTKAEITYDTFPSTVQWYTWLAPESWTVQTRTRYIDNAATVGEYDFASNAPGGLARSTNTSWANSSSAPSLWSRHIWDKPLLTEVHGGSVPCLNGRADDLCSQTQYEYDNYTGYSGPLAASNATQGRAGGFGAGFTTRGNATATKRWRSTDGALLATYRQYDDAGNVIGITDPLLHQTTYSFSTANQAAYVTQIQHPSTSSPGPASHIENFSYYFNTGLKASSTDMNGKTTSYAYDSFDRLSTITYPAQSVNGQSINGQTSFNYWLHGELLSNLNLVEQVDSMDRAPNPDKYNDTWMAYDGIGREVVRVVFNDNGTSNVWDRVDTCYDGRSLVTFRLYPYLSPGGGATWTCSGAGDSFIYDPLGRRTKVTHADGTHIDTTFAGRAVKVTDEGNGTYNVGRVSQSDVLGRVTDVCEIASATLQGGDNSPVSCGLDIAATGFKTTYQYDALGNLKTVIQPGLTNRTFTYDSLSELLTAFNPESGATVSYGYNSDGNLVSRIRPRPNNASGNTTTTYAYDPLTQRVPAHLLKTRKVGMAMPTPETIH